MEKKLHQLLNIEKLKFASETIGLLKHPNRINIINIFLEQGDQYSAQIYSKLDLPSAEISNHLLLLRKHGFLTQARHSYNEKFSLNINAYEKVIEISEDLYKG